MTGTAAAHLPGSAVRVDVVAVGDELLSGAVVNTNLADLGRRLNAAGAVVGLALTVGDDLAGVADAVRHAVAGPAEVVVVTGGLGPTVDDITREALALVAGVAIAVDPGVLDQVRASYQQRGRPLPAAAARMAEVPDGATVLVNGVGTAPGLRIDIGDTPVLALPGVPAEMRGMVDSHVLPLVQALRPGVVATRTARVALLGESAVAERLAEVEADLARDRDPALPRLAYLAEPGDVRVRLSAWGASGPAAREALEPWLQRVRSSLGDVVYGEDDESLDRVVHSLLAAAGATVAAAESLTGGLLGADLSAMPGASGTFRGGVTAYATDAKAALLDVDAALLMRVGAVDPDVAAAMARGVQRRFAATYGVATTGVAGPEEQDGAPVGTLHVAVAGPAGEVVSSERVTGSREVVRRLAVVRALDLLRRSLQGLPPFGGA